MSERSERIIGNAPGHRAGPEGPPVSESEAIVRTLLAAMKGATDESFAEAVTYLTDEATYRPNGWKRDVVGRDAVLAELCGTGAHYADLDIEVVSVVDGGTSVVAERVDRFAMAGTRIELHVVGIFDVGPDGRITAWRDYYDAKEIDRQLRP